MSSSFDFLAHSVADHIVKDMSTEDLMNIAYQYILDSYSFDHELLRIDFETIHFCQDDPEEASKEMINLLSKEGFSIENSLQLFDHLYN